MNLDLKEVRGQDNVLWKLKEDFDIIVDLSSFDIISKESGAEMWIMAEYNGGSTGRKIFPKPNEKEIKITHLPFGKKINIYFECVSDGYIDFSPFYMYFYNESTGRNENEYYEITTYSGSKPVQSVKKLITSGHNSTMPMTVRLFTRR